MGNLKEPQGSGFGSNGSGTVFLGLAVMNLTADQVLDLLATAHQALASAQASASLSTLSSLAVVAASTVVVAASRRAVARERQLARRDSLTELPNRRGFLELAEAELERASRRGLPVTVAFVDLDHFKEINDRLGHAEGDRVLQAVGRVLGSSIRESDLAARLGGDEFVVLLPGARSADADRILANLRERLLAAMREGGWPVTFSIGAVSTAEPEGIGELLAKADQLMYEVKRGGRDAARVAEWASEAGTARGRVAA